MTGLARRLSATIVAGMLATTACGSAGHSAGTRTPRLVVAAGLYPLAQAAEQIGQGRAVALEVVPGGTFPPSFRPDAASVTAISKAGLLLLAPEGLQPGLDRLHAAGDRPAVHVSAHSGGTFFWLDPHAMRQAVPAIAAAMEEADPHDAATFRQGATAFEDALASTDIDYQSTLSTCPRRDVFAPDAAFAAVAQTYGLVFHNMGAANMGAGNSGAGVGSLASAVSATGATTVFTETWVPATTARAVAAASGARTAELDTLLGPPPGGWPRQATYVNLLERNLGLLSAALGCPDLGTGM